MYYTSSDIDKLIEREKIKEIAKKSPEKFFECLDREDFSEEKILLFPILSEIKMRKKIKYSIPPKASYKKWRKEMLPMTDVANVMFENDYETSHTKFERKLNGGGYVDEYIPDKPNLEGVIYMKREHIERLSVQQTRYLELDNECRKLIENEKKKWDEISRNTPERYFSEKRYRSEKYVPPKRPYDEYDPCLYEEQDFRDYIATDYGYDEDWYC